MMKKRPALRSFLAKQCLKQMVLMTCVLFFGANLFAQADGDNVSPAQTQQMQLELKQKKVYMENLPTSRILTDVACTMGQAAPGKKVIVLSIPSGASGQCLERLKALEMEWELRCTPMPGPGATTVGIEVDASVKGMEFFNALAERGIFIRKQDISGI